MSIYALLVGINNYLSDRIQNLAGCSNDVDLINKMLISRFNVSESNIQILKDEEATKSNIVKAFETHLVRAKDKDSVIFYFSGHGSQEPSAPEFWHIDYDKQLETLVCHDSNVNDTQLSDKELRFLVSKLHKKLAQVLLVVDSCHSGNINRFIENDHVAVRQTSMLTSPRKMRDFIFYEEMVSNDWINDLKAIPQGRHILLSACHRSELSQEQVIAGVRYGVFTYSLYKVIENSSHTPSYYNLLTHIRHITRKYNYHQTPQIDAEDSDINKVFLSQTIQAVKLNIYKESNKWWIDVGRVYGLNVNDEVAIFLPNGKDNTPLLFAQIQSVGVGRSLLKEVYSYHFNTAIRTLNDLEGDSIYSAQITLQNIDKLYFSLEGNNEQVICRIREVLNKLKNGVAPSDFIEENKGKAKYQLTYHEDGTFFIIDANEKSFRPLFEPAKSELEVLQQLENIKRFEQKLDLINRNANFDTNTIQLVITDNESGKESVDKDITLSYDSRNISPPSATFTIRCNSANMPKKTLYCALVLFDPLTTEVSSALANGIKLTPSINDGEICQVMCREGIPVTFNINDEIFKKGITEITDFVKLIVSDTPFDASLLDQEGFEVFKSGYRSDSISDRHINELENLLEQAMQYAHVRSFHIRKRSQIPFWYTKTFEIKIVREKLPIVISSYEEIILADGVLIKPHPTLRASVRLTNYRGVNITPVIFRDDSQTSSLVFVKTKNINTDLSVLKIDYEHSLPNREGSTAITAKTPLVININGHLEDNVYVLPYSYIGEVYFPLGFSRVVEEREGLQVFIEDLPSGWSNFIGSAEKGFGKSLNIYFQKILSERLALGSDPNVIAIPVFDPIDQTKVIDYITDIHDIEVSIQSANKILLFIHGILGETKSIVGAANLDTATGNTIADQYDIILTFDYENLNTPIIEIAKILKKKLQRLGLDSSHMKQLDIIAHSMGGLVVRYFIEIEGGDKVVRKLAMLGVPNKGIAFSNIKEKGSELFKNWANNVLLALLNGYITYGVGNLVVAGLIRIMEAIDNSLDDMHPESRLLGILAHTQQPNIPYMIVAGDTSLRKLEVNDSDDELLNTIAKRAKYFIYKQLSDYFFKKDNDTLVSVESACFLPNKWDNYKIVITTCDHLSYFQDKETITALQDFFTERFEA